MALCCGVKLRTAEELFEELKKNNIRIRALIDLYEKTTNESSDNQEETHIRERKAEYIRMEILKATAFNDKLLKEI